MGLNTVDLFQSICIIGRVILINNTADLKQEENIIFRTNLDNKIRHNKIPFKKTLYETISRLYAAITSCKKLEIYHA